MSYQCLGCGAKLLNRDECARCDRETIADLTDENAKLKARIADLEASAAAMLARLKAAERVCEAADGLDLTGAYALCRAIREWRTLKEKSNGK